MSTVNYDSPTHNATLHSQLKFLRPWLFEIGEEEVVVDLQVNETKEMVAYQVGVGGVLFLFFAIFT